MPGPANSINESTTGITGFTGTSFVGTPVTNHSVIVGGATSSSLTNVGPTATAGQVLQSAGSSADPAFSTATYPTTTTVSQILYSSATNVVSGLATANNGTLITSATGVPSLLANGTTGQVFTATTGSPPSWASPAAGTGVNKVITQTFTAPGTATYTPSTGMLYCIVEVIGAGGGGGGCASTTAAQLSVGGGGGSGAYARTTFSAADIGASKTYTVGAGGAGGTAGANNGSSGASSTFGTGGTLVQSGGGGGGIGGAASTTTSFNLGGTPGVGVVPPGGTGPFAAGGASGDFGQTNFGVFQFNGRGGSSYLGSQAQYRTTTGVGIQGSQGTGGSGAFGFVSAAAQAGGAGGDGIIIITEFTT